MSDAGEPVHCDLHGETPATFVCIHLFEGVSCGFNCSDERAGDPWPDAWCDACEAGFQQKGEWDDDQKIKLLCTGCYEVVRARNVRVPEPLKPGEVSVDEDRYAEFAEAAYERTRELQEAAQRRWGFGEKKRWDFDDETSTIRFSAGPMDDAIVADVTITGSFSRRTATWMWAWGNDQYSDAERAKVDPVRVFGEVRRIAKLANAHWPCEEIDAWEVTQIAADLLGAEALYRAPFDNMLVFMLLNNFRTERPS